MNRSDLIAYFDSIGFHPSHRLGQNFLIDRNIARKLVELSDCAPTDKACEIGPGMGMISNEILETGASLVAVEKDRRLLDYLHINLVPKHKERFSLVQGDALNLPLGGSTEVEALLLIANPPFAITGPWLAGVLDCGFPKTLALLLQKEAVDRLTASANSKLFGVLTIRLQAAYSVSDLHPVPSKCFYPEPSILSQIVVFKRKTTPVAFHPQLIRILQCLFQQRRKQIGGRLKKLIHTSVFEAWEGVLANHDLSMQSRPEQIPTDVWMELNSKTTFEDMIQKS